MKSSNKSQSIYRVDKFTVPHTARDKFLPKVQSTHKFLRTLPGYIQDFVLEQTSGPGEFNFVTIVKWDSLKSFEKAKTSVKKMQENKNFNPKELFTELGIKADLGNYRPVD